MTWQTRKPRSLKWLSVGFLRAPWVVPACHTTGGILPLGFTRKRVRQAIRIICALLAQPSTEGHRLVPGYANHWAAVMLVVELRVHPEFRLLFTHAPLP